MPDQLVSPRKQQMRLATARAPQWTAGQGLRLLQSMAVRERLVGGHRTDGEVVALTLEGVDFGRSEDLGLTHCCVGGCGGFVHGKVSLSASGSWSIRRKWKAPSIP